MLLTKKEYLKALIRAEVQNNERLCDLVDLDGLNLVTIKMDTVQVVNNFINLATTHDRSLCGEG